MAVDFLYLNEEVFNEFSYRKKFQGEWARILLDGEPLFLLKPSTFMNLSGISVRAFMDFYNILPQDILVVYDDIDLELGKIRVKRKGSSGGHKGMASIIDNVGTSIIPRIRLGIGPRTQIDMINFVLGKFRENELPIVKQVLKDTRQVIHLIAKDGIEKAMAKFNG